MSRFLDNLAVLFILSFFMLGVSALLAVCILYWFQVLILVIGCVIISAAEAAFTTWRDKEKK